MNMIVQNCTLIRALKCNDTQTAYDAANVLKENKQRRLIVVGSDEKPIGILSTTDINNKVVAENKIAKDTKVQDIMTSNIYLVCDVNDDLNQIYKKMHEHETFFVPVTKNNKLYGILTYAELMKRANVKLNG